MTVVKDWNIGDERSETPPGNGSPEVSEAIDLSDQVETEEGGLREPDYYLLVKLEGKILSLVDNLVTLIARVRWRKGIVFQEVELHFSYNAVIGYEEPKVKIWKYYSRLGEIFITRYKGVPWNLWFLSIHRDN